MSRIRTLVLALGAVGGFVAAGCGGGQQTAGAPQALPLVTATPPNNGTPPASAAVSLRVVIPASAAPSATRRGPAYVSVSTNSLTFSQNGGAAQTMSLVAGSPSCTTSSGTRTCTVNLNATSGSNQAFTIKLFASTDGSGTPLSAQMLVATIVANQNNPIAATLNGVVASLSVSLTKATLQYGEPGESTSVVVNVLDASGNTIVGPGVFADANGNPITVTLADSDTTGSTALAQTTVTQPTTVGLSYNGGGVTSVAITATTGSITSPAAMLSLVCGKPSTTNALYINGLLSPNGASSAYGYGEFALTASGVNLTPANQVDTPVGGGGLGVDGRGFVYDSATSQSGGAYVAQYCPTASGAATPYRSYPEPLPPGGSNPSVNLDVAVDSQGDLFTLTSAMGGFALFAFAPDSGNIGFPASAPIAPTATIAGSNTQLGVFLAADASGTAYVGTQGQITEYVRGTSGNAPPSKTVANTAGGLIGALNARVDSAGDVYALYSSNNLSELDPATPVGAPALVEYAHGQYSTPIRVISGPATQLGASTPPLIGAFAIALDPSGNMYVLSTAGNSYEVQEFGANANGNVPPIATFAVSAGQATDIAADGNGNVAVSDVSGSGVLLYHNGSFSGALNDPNYVDNRVLSVAYDSAGYLYFYTENGNGNQFSGGAVLVYPPNSNSSTTPTKVLGNSGRYSQLAVDANGNMYGLSGLSAGRGVDVYIAPITSGTPTRSFFPPFGYAVGATGIGADAAGNIYLATMSYVEVFAPSSSGPAVPQASYFDLNGSTLNPAIAVDASGTVYAASCTTNSVGVYPPGSTGGTPARSIVGPNTLILCPDSIAVDSAGNIYVESDLIQTFIVVFAAGANGNVTPMQTIFANMVPGFSGDKIAIGAGFGTVPSSIGRAAAAHGRFRLTLQSGHPAALGLPACPASRKGVAVAADGRVPHAAPPASGPTNLGSTCSWIDVLRSRRAGRGRR